MAFFPNYNNYTAYNPYQPQMMNPFQNGNSSPMQPQTQVVIRVPSYDVVKTYPVEAGKPLTFFDDNTPFCYVKTGSASPAETPKIRIFELVERTEEELTQIAKNGDFSNVSEKSIDTSDFVKKLEFDEFRQSFEAIIKSVDKLRFDVDALGDKSTKKLVQKARKDADDE